MFIGLFLCVGVYIQELAVLHSSAARMETVSGTLLLCAIISMTVETIVMNLDVVSHNIEMWDILDCSVIDACNFTVCSISVICMYIQYRSK